MKQRLGVTGDIRDRWPEGFGAGGAFGVTLDPPRRLAAGDTKPSS